MAGQVNDVREHAEPVDRTVRPEDAEHEPSTCFTCWTMSHCYACGGVLVTDEDPTGASHAACYGL